MLLYHVCKEADNILTSTNILEEEPKKFDDVLAKFDVFFKVQQNVIVERVKFNENTVGWQKCQTVHHHIVSPCGNMRI